MFAFNLMTSRENYISFLAINQKIIWKVYQALSTLRRASLVAQMVKNLPAVQETPGSISGLRKSPGEGNDYPPQYSYFPGGLDG